MTDRASLLRAVCANPDEDTPRLAYAEWLEQHGGEEGADHAMLIRLQITEGARSHQAICRQAPILHRWIPVWSQEVERLLCQWREWLAPYYDGPAPCHDRLSCSVSFDRGFPGHMTCTTPEFLAFAGLIFVRHPITAVRLLSQHPSTCAASGMMLGQERWEEVCFCWVRDQCSVGSYGPYLDAELFDRLPKHRRLRGTDPDVAVYPTVVHADDALEDACLAYGRGLRDRIFAGELPDDVPVAPKQRIRPFAGFPGYIAEPDAPLMPAGEGIPF